MIEKAKAAQFDERLTVLGLLMDAVGAETVKIVEEDQLMQALLASLKRIKGTLGRQPLVKAVESETQAVKDRMENGIPVNDNTMVEVLDLTNYLGMDFSSYFGDYRPPVREDVFKGNY